MHPHDPRILLTHPMRSVLDRIARAGKPPMHALSAQQARDAYEKAAGVLEGSPLQLPVVEQLQVTTRDGQRLAARLFAPSREELPVLLYFHGGGFTVGSIDTHDGLCRSLSHLARCAVISVDYRLAPECPFPYAFQDCWDSLRWVERHARDLGLREGEIAVGGDSAGGTLATACAIQARDEGIALRLQMLFYPGCSAHQDTESHRRFARGFLLDDTQIQWFFKQYLRTPADRDDWRFAPLLVPDAADCAPAWLGLAECDPFFDEGIAYADLLRRASVTVDLEIYRGVVHEFIKMGRAIPEAQRARRDAATALRRAFHLE